MTPNHPHSDPLGLKTQPVEMDLHVLIVGLLFVCKLIMGVTSEAFMPLPSLPIQTSIFNTLGWIV